MDEIDWPKIAKTFAAVNLALAGLFAWAYKAEHTPEPRPYGGWNDKNRWE